MLFIDAKTPTSVMEVSWNAYDLLRKIISASAVTISGGTAAIQVDPDSEIDDPDVASMLVGAAVVNAAPVTIDGRTIPAGNVVSVAVQNGVPGCLYLLTFVAQLSASPLVEDEQFQFRCLTRLPPTREIARN